MPQIDRQVSHLNADVTAALQAIRNPAQATETEAKAVRTAILKDGTIDDAETDLIAELTQDNAQGIRVSGQGSATASLTLNAFNDDAQDPLAISMLALGRRKAELLYDRGVARVERGVQQVRTAYQEAKVEFNELREDLGESFDQLLEDSADFMTELFTFQYGEGSDDERQANCGPSSASMIIKQLGMEPPSLHDMRRMVGAPTGNGNGAFAMSTDQVGRAVRQVGAQYGRDIRVTTQNLPTNVDAALNAIRAKLEAGEQVILLSSNIMVQSGSRGKGHYVVVKEVLPNGSIVVDDPQSPPERGLGRTHTKAQFANSLQRRVNFGRPNQLISFAETH
ncbi:MAG: hypothetical protein ACO1RX_13575 [Candidatus Sericytochromatia bacterium]